MPSPNGNADTLERLREIRRAIAALDDSIGEMRKDLVSVLLFSGPIVTVFGLLLVMLLTFILARIG
jgi:hypothetical protein